MKNKLKDVDVVFDKDDFKEDPRNFFNHILRMAGIRDTSKIIAFSCKLKNIKVMLDTY